MRTSAFIPGLICGGLEFFNKGGKTKFLQSGQVKDLSELPYPVIEKLKKIISSNADLEEELKFHYPESEWKRIEMLVHCRYGGLDFFPDVENGEMKDGDYWACPLRGSCRSEGIICKNLKFNDVEIEPTEIKLMQLLTTSDTNDVIAEKLEIPLGSFHLLKKHLYQKLKVATKQELTLLALKLNIIQL